MNTDIKTDKLNNKQKDLGIHPILLSAMVDRLWTFRNLTQRDQNAVKIRLNERLLSVQAMISAAIIGAVMARLMKYPIMHRHTNKL